MDDSLASPKIEKAKDYEEQQNKCETQESYGSHVL